MPVKIDTAQFDAWQRGMLAFSRARIEPKERSPVMLGASLFLGEKFRTEFSTTIPDPAALLNPSELLTGPESVIFMPRAHADLPEVRKAPLLGHECHHSWLNQQSWPKEPWFYAVSSESRVEDEVQCIVVGASLSLRLEGGLPDPEERVQSLVAAYHLSPPDGPLARELLKSAWAAFAAGLRIPPTPVAVEAHRLLDALGVGWA